MPLELGIFLGAKRYGNAEQKLKRLLILDVEQFRYQKFISDLAGMDIHGHHGDALLALRVTRDWLANVSRRILSSADRIAASYLAFQTDLPEIAAKLHFDPIKIPYVDFERIVVTWLKNAPEIAI